MRPTGKKFRARFRASFILLLVVLGVTGHASMVMAQPQGAFTATGSMTTPRSWHTATLLTNGKVLIVGGVGPTFNVTLASAELYDPYTGTFTPTGYMTTARRLHTATLLADGRVLIAGGFGAGVGYVTPASAELYDPYTGTFAATGDAITPPGVSKSVLLGNGKVLIASHPAQLYDSATGTFAATGLSDDTSVGYVVTATLLPDGSVLITGWSSPAAVGALRAELYDPSAGTFIPTGPPDPNIGDLQTATLLTDGKVLFEGGDCEESDAAEVYDPSAGTFAATGRMNAARSSTNAATLLPDGTVLISGPKIYDLRTGAPASAELYNPATGTFAAAGSMTAPRFWHTATLLPDGTVLIAGGFSGWPSATSSAELYEPPLLQAAPVLLSLSGDGRGQGAILDGRTNQVASSSNPATVGEVLEIYCTGLVEESVIPPQVAIGGRMAEVLFFGKAPGFAGLNQVNVRVPSGVAPGDAVPVRLNYIGRPSNEVTIGVR